MAFASMGGVDDGAAPASALAARALLDLGPAAPVPTVDAAIEPAEGAWTRGWDVVMCLVPIAFLIATTVIKPIYIRTSLSLPMAAALMWVIRLAYLQFAPNFTNAAVIYGLLDALTPLSIIAGAIVLFQAMEQTQCLAWIMAKVRRLSSGHPVAEVFLIAWAFSYMIEGASGFGTPTALAAPMLVSLGHPPVETIVACLAMNAQATVFGAVGTPLWFGLGGLGLSQSQLRRVGFIAEVMLTATAHVVPVLAASFLVRWRDLARSWLFVLLSIWSAVIPATLLALVSTDFSSLVGGMVAVVVVGALSAFRIGLGAFEPKAFDKLKARGGSVGSGGGDGALSPAAEPNGKATITAASTRRRVAPSEALSDSLRGSAMLPASHGVGGSADYSVTLAVPGAASAHSAHTATANALYNASPDSLHGGEGRLVTAADVVAASGDGARRTDAPSAVAEAVVESAERAGSARTVLGETYFNYVPNRLDEATGELTQDADGSNAAAPPVHRTPSAQRSLESFWRSGSAQSAGGGDRDGAPGRVSPSMRLGRSWRGLGARAASGSGNAVSLHDSGAPLAGEPPATNGGNVGAWLLSPGAVEPDVHSSSTGRQFDPITATNAGAVAPAAAKGPLGSGNHLDSVAAAVPQDATEKPLARGGFGAAILRTMPLWLTLVLLVVTRIEPIGVRERIRSTSPSFSISLGTFLDLDVSAYLVFTVSDILGETDPSLVWAYQALYVPALVPFVLVSIITVAVFRRDLPRGATVLSPFAAALRRVAKIVPALLGSLVLVALIRRGDTPTASPAYIIGYNLADFMSDGFIAISAVLGALGSFFSGSTTVSNLTFGVVQKVAAEGIDVDTEAMLALQAVGGTAGNMVCINNIIAAMAVVGGLAGVSEGAFILRTAPLLLVMLIIATGVAVPFLLL